MKFMKRYQIPLLEKLKYGIVFDLSIENYII
jgi:hypothetical protein